MKIRSVDLSPPSGERFILGPSAAAACLGISRSGLNRLRATGDFPRPVQLTPRRIGFRVEELNAWLSRRQNGAQLEGGAR